MHARKMDCKLPANAVRTNGECNIIKNIEKRRTVEIKHTPESILNDFRIIRKRYHVYSVESRGGIH